MRQDGASSPEGGQAMTPAVTIGILLLIVTANYWFRRSVLYPPFLFSLMWLIDLTLHAFHFIDIYPLHSQTLSVIAIGAALYSAGGFCSFLVPHKVISTRITLIGLPKNDGRGIKLLVTAIVLAGVCFSIRSAMQVAASSGAGGLFFAAARNASIQDINAGRSGTSWVSYVGTWSIFAAVLFQAERTDRLSWIATGIAFISSLLSGGRTSLLSLFASLTCIYLIRTKRERFIKSFRFARWPILAFVLLFGGLIFLNKNTSTVAGKGILAIAGTSVTQYILGPTAALDQVLQHLRDYQGASNHTFQFFMRIASALHIASYTPPPTLDEWIFVPFATNVYTYYKFIIVDFGVPFALLLTGIVGFVHTLLFRKAHTGSILGLYIFALSMYSVFMVIFDDAYFRFGMYLGAAMFAGAILTIRSIPWTLFRATSPEESTG